TAWMRPVPEFLIFLLKYTATSGTFTLSLHDALPIYPELFGGGSHEFVGLPLGGDVENCVVPCPLGPGAIIGTQRFQPATAQVGIEVLGLFPSTVRARLKHCSEGCPNKSASCRSLKVSSGPSRANPIGESARSDVTMSESSAPVLRG